MPRKAFLLRIDPDVLAAVQRQADADLRSLNAQIEYLLREAVMKRDGKRPDSPNGESGSDTDPRPAVTPT